MFASKTRVSVLDCPLVNPTPVNAHVVIAFDVGVPRRVLAPAILTVNVPADAPNDVL